jgi:hypothetical protein
MKAETLAMPLKILTWFVRISKKPIDKPPRQIVLSFNKILTIYLVYCPDTTSLCYWGGEDLFYPNTTKLCLFPNILQIADLYEAIFF